MPKMQGPNNNSKYTHTMSNTQNPYPPKTARWWFAEYLPEPYRGQAIANYDKQFNGEIQKEDIATLSHALGVSFFWGHSYQGSDYWLAIAIRADNGEFSTPNTHEPTAEKLPFHLPDEMREAGKYLRVKMGMDKLPEQIQSATASFAGVDTDAFMDEVRGRNTLNTYNIKTAQFEATIICADIQGAMDLLFNFMINSCAFEFRFDRSNVTEGWMTPEGAKAGIIEFKRR